MRHKHTQIIRRKNRTRIHQPPSRPSPIKTAAFVRKNITGIHQPPSRPSPIKTAAFVSGGLGDAFAVECYLTNEERASIKSIFLGTRKWKLIREAWREIPNYPKLNNLVKMWDDNAEYWCFFNKNDARRLLDIKHEEFEGSIDLSIGKIFQAAERGARTYNECSFLMVEKELQLKNPKEYLVICPYSTDKRDNNRDFTSDDWLATQELLEKEQLPGVVLNTGADFVPSHPLLIDLSNKTTEMEAVEVVKRSQGYIGIDSSMSVIAAKALNKLQIKSTNEHLFRWKHIYYAPKNKFEFIVPEIVPEWHS